MSGLWHWFVLLGTFGSLAVLSYVLFSHTSRADPTDVKTGHSHDGIEEFDNPLPLWWVAFFFGTIVFALLYLTVFPGLGNTMGMFGWSSADEHDQRLQAYENRFRPLYAALGAMSEDQLHADPKAQQIGRRLYLNNCASCHGSGREGTEGFPALIDTEWAWGNSFEAVRNSITYGRTGVMPGWQETLGDSGVQAVAHHVRRLAGLAHDSTLADAGVAHFMNTCVACHQADGRGNALLGAPDLTNNLWQYGGDLEALTVTIAHGRNGQMPEHGSRMSPERIHILAGWLTSAYGSK